MLSTFKTTHHLSFKLCNFYFFVIFECDTKMFKIKNLQTASVKINLIIFGLNFPTSLNLLFEPI